MEGKRRDDLDDGGPVSSAVYKYNIASYHLFFNDGKEKKYMEKSQEHLEMTGWARQGQLGRELVALT